jgi:hypothetical protein
MSYPKPNKTIGNKVHLAWMQENGWTPAPKPYAEEQILKNKRFLIVCEGENTEKEYFEAFPVLGKDIIEIEIIGGLSGGKKFLITEAIKLATKDEYKEYEVWCVFDFDVKYDNSTQKEDFDNAIKMGLSNNFKIAFSNDAFELWFVLHHRFIENKHIRNQYFDMLTDIWELEHSYESMGKKREFCKKHYKKLLPLQERAIRNATKLHESLNDGRPHHEMNPCTTVYQLVLELNKYIRK